jgi:histidine triad (HIT) family protein
MEANIKKYIKGTRAISGCVFCKHFTDKTYDELLPNGIMRINPLNPVVNNHSAPHDWIFERFRQTGIAPSKIREDYQHTMFVPVTHGEDAADDPHSAAQAFYAAADYVDRMGIQANIITSIGTAATQSVFHTNIHVVPRDHDDILMLPWSFQDKPLETEWGSSHVRFKKFESINEAPSEIKKYFDNEYKDLHRTGIWTDYESLH